jgi:hypothetical protein
LLLLNRNRVKKTRKTKNEKRGKACARGFSCFFMPAIGVQLAFLFVVFRWKIKAIVLCVLGAVEGLREVRLRRSFFFFSLLSYSLLLPLVSRRRGGGGRTPLIKKIVKIAIGCMPRFFGRRARDAARGRGDNSFSFPFSF